MPIDPEMPLPKGIKASAQMIMDLNADEFSRLQYLEKHYAMKTNDNKEIMRSIREIDSYIMESIQFDNELWTRDAKSTWALLRSLQKRLAPTDQGRKVDVIKLYNSLKVYNKDQTVERFLYELSQA